MAHVICTHTPGRSLDDYRAVEGALGPDRPEGRLGHIVGEVDGVLHIIDVWDSKQNADRFASERLFPAFLRTDLGPTSDATYVEFEGEFVPFTGAAR